MIVRTTLYPHGLGRNSIATKLALKASAIVMRHALGPDGKGGKGR